MCICTRSWEVRSSNVSHASSFHLSLSNTTFFPYTHIHETKRFGPDYRVTNVDLASKTVSFSGGASLKFNSLISTIPLDLLLRMPGVNQPQWADGLTHSSSHIIGFGIRGQ